MHLATQTVILHLLIFIKNIFLKFILSINRGGGWKYVKHQLSQTFRKCNRGMILPMLNYSVYLQWYCVFFKKNCQQTIQFFQQINVKMSIYYMAAGFEPTTPRTWVSPITTGPELPPPQWYCFFSEKIALAINSPSEGTTSIFLLQTTTSVLDSRAEI